MNLPPLDDDRYERPGFCERCGRPLVLKDGGPVTYDAYTGEAEEPEKWLVCPKSGFHSRFPVHYSRLKAGAR